MPRVLFKSVSKKRKRKKSCAVLFLCSPTTEFCYKQTQTNKNCAEYRRVQVRRPQGKLERIPERLNKVGLQEEDFKVYMPFKGQAAKEPNTAFKLTDTIKMSKRDLKG